MDIKERIAELQKQIEYHSNLYYNEDNPEILDYDFDMLMQELKQLEQEHPEYAAKDSPTQKVGGKAKRQAGVLVRHNVPMLSLQDVFSKEEVLHFVEEMKGQLDDPEFVVEYKIDGLSMSLRYEYGELKLAETRGDGINFGEDVTENAKVIKDVRQKLKDTPEYLEIRGEVFMKNADFESVNKAQELLGKKAFANPRNCAAGTLRQLDPAVTKERKLSMFIFNIQQVRGISFATHTQGYEFLKRQGVPVIDGYTVCKTGDEVWAAIEEISENRGNLPYDIDGAVVPSLYPVDAGLARQNYPQTAILSVRFFAPAKNAGGDPSPSGIALRLSFPASRGKTACRSRQMCLTRSRSSAALALFQWLMSPTRYPVIRRIRLKGRGARW